MLIDFKEKNNYLILYLQGRMDVKYSSDIESDLNNIISQNPDKGVLLNLQKVEYMSSSGLRLFVTLMRKLKEQNRPFRLCNLTPSVIKIFEVVELLDMFDIYGDEAEAIA